MREDHLLEKDKFPALLQRLHSSDLIENQNSFSASLEQESKMDLGRKLNIALLNSLLVEVPGLEGQAVNELTDQVENNF